MKYMDGKKKAQVGIVVTLITLTILIGISYALWTFNITQESINTITSGCLKLTLTEESNAINLRNAYPITDNEASNIEPYIFKIENICNSEVTYNISLEMMEIENRLNSKYIAISIDNGQKSILNTLEETEVTYNKGDYTSVEGRMLINGVLKGNESKSHSIRLWMDESVPATEETMNKTFLGKVVLNATIKEPSPPLANFITNLVETNPEELAYDGTIDNNLRYIGANPNNYILFNNELWRIIGVMNNIEDSEGNKASHIKIIRNESIGDNYWSGSSTNASNDWAKSSLNTNILNGTFYNSLNDDAKNMVSNIVWNIGGVTSVQVPTRTVYEEERGTSAYGNNVNTWTGSIGLMYASDYGYAVGGDVKDTCLNNNLFSYNYNDCYSNDWLFIEKYQLTLTPENSKNYICHTDEVGQLRSNIVTRFSATIRPTLYLNTNTIITGMGDGSINNPYLLQTN